MESPTIVASAPGKVLLAGGYLVLDRAYQGLVLGLDARIHVCVKDLEKTKDNAGRIVVKSPQFKQAHWDYRFTTASDSVQVRQTKESESSAANPFIATTLNYVLTYLSHLSGVTIRPVSIVILADASYYSHSRSSVKGSFVNFGTTLADTHKTGLGSSAALVTALTAALLQAFHPDPNDIVIHNLSQASHCAAQGKIGSGFDVAAAVYGTCLYRRFSPSILARVGEAGSEGFGERLHRCVENLELEQPWDAEVLPHEVHVPENIGLVMCDVDCGSSTPGMVKKVLEWRQQSPEEANLLWSALQQGTQDLCHELKRLTVEVGIKANDHKALGDIIATIRSLVQEMSSKSDVPIEPAVQTKLLDACGQVPGVIGGVVPGAGGYDAVVLLTSFGSADQKTGLPSLTQALDTWNAAAQGHQHEGIGKVSILGVKLGKEGVRTETAEKYKEWL